MDLFVCFFLGVGIVAAVVGLRRRYADFWGQQPDDYTDGFPALDLRRDLDGRMLCEGVIYGPTGRVSSSFVADFDISWDGDTGVMTEHFRFNDGTTQDRVWTIRLGENGQFTATAPDVVGKGRGVQAGPAIQMLYRITLPESSGGHTLDTVDWMYLTPDGTIINRSQFRKFGMRVAELVASIRKVEDPQ